MMHPCQKLAENYVINRLHYLLIWRQIGRHLWYLSEELVGLALFDPKVSLEMKRLMLAAMEDSAPGSSTKATRSEFCCISEHIGFCSNSVRKIQNDSFPHLAREHIDRLPIIISGVGVEQLLGVPKLPSGTDEAQATAVIMSLEEWGVTNRVAALCFDHRLIFSGPS